MMTLKEGVGGSRLWVGSSTQLERISSSDT